MKVITFAAEKGGTGKSSVCFNSAWKMSEDKKILILDLDGQRANISYFCGIQKTEDTLTMYDALMRDTDFRKCIVPVKENLDIVPATYNVANITNSAKITKFRKLVNMVKDDYDYIFIDISPSPSWIHVLSLSVSNYVIVVNLPDAASLESFVGISETIQEIQETVNPSLSVLGIVLNRWDGRTNLAKQSLGIAKNFAEQMDTSVFDSKIRNASAIGECVYYHVGITEYAKRSNVTNDYLELIKEIEGRLKENG